MSALQATKVPSLHKLLSDLFGRSVPVQATPKFEPSAAKGCVIAIYADNQDQIAGILVCSLAAAAYLGAALSLLPKSIADESAKKGNLDEVLLENFQEVANICASLFAEHLGCRIHLMSVIAKAVAHAAEHKAFLQSALRTDWMIDVPNYGSGPVSIRIGRGTSAQSDRSK